MAERAILSKNVKMYLPTGFFKLQMLTRSFVGTVVPGPDVTVGNWTAQGLNGVVEVVVAGAGGGTFTLTFEGQTTSAIAYNATPLVVETALASLSTVGAGNVVVTGHATGIYLIEWIGALGQQPQTSVTANGSGLTPANEIQLITLPVNASSGTFTLAFGGHTTTSLAYNAPSTGAGSVQTALQALASIGSGNATVTGPNGGAYIVTFASALAATPEPLIGAIGSSLVYTPPQSPAPAISVVETQKGAASATVTVTAIQTGTVDGSATTPFNQANNLVPSFVQTRLSASAPTSAKNANPFNETLTGTVTIPVPPSSSEEKTRIQWNGVGGFYKSRQLNHSWMTDPAGNG